MYFLLSPPHSYGQRTAGGPPPRSPSGSARTVMPAKQKILTILDRARNAMEESYGGGYDEAAYDAPPPPHFDSYPSYGQAAAVQRGSRYEMPAEYDPTEYGRREYFHREATSYPGM